MIPIFILRTNLRSTNYTARCNFTKCMHISFKSKVRELNNTLLKDLVVDSRSVRCQGLIIPL